MLRKTTIRGNEIQLHEEPELLAVRLGDAACYGGNPPIRWRGRRLVPLAIEDAPEWVRSAFEMPNWTIVRVSDEPVGEGSGVEPGVVGRLFRDEQGRWLIATGVLTVRLKDDLDAATVRELLSRFDLRVLRECRFAPWAFEVRVPEERDFIDVGSELQADDRVCYAEPQFIGERGPRDA